MHLLTVQTDHYTANCLQCYCKRVCFGQVICLTLFTKRQREHRIHLLGVMTTVTVQRFNGKNGGSVSLVTFTPIKLT